MQPIPLTPDAQRLSESLTDIPQPETHGETVHVDGVGGRLIFAYEQLRNAAEYTEQHLLMRRAVERFLQRTVDFRHDKPIATELVIDLTQSRYLKNDTVAESTIAGMDNTLARFAQLFREASAYEKETHKLREWILQTASVHLEQYLAPHSHTGAFADFAYRHYLQLVQEPSLTAHLEPQRYRLALYAATHRAIMKSDIATTRAYALSSQVIEGPDNHPEYFVYVCRMLDEVYQEKSTNRLLRLISQYGAPLRILREIVITDSSLPQLLQDRNRTLERVRSATEQQYALVGKRLKQGIIRSVLFIAITKILLGVGLEVPYDIVRHGKIIWPPLILNILFPPLYMATLGLGIRKPHRKNITLVEQAVEKIIYQTGEAIQPYRLRRRVQSSAMTSMFDGLYAVTVVLWIALLAWLLHQLHFTLVSGVIFFIFLSTVSFFGFRLTQTAREYEMLEARRGILGLAGDFLYTPFIRFGHWLSDSYSRLNVVTRILDIFIEMPMKSLLRFMRQWVGFLRDKQEEL